MALKVARSRFFHNRYLLTSFTLLAAHVVTPVVRAQESVVQLDVAQTKIDFTLGADFHTVHGTFKLKSGAIRFDPATGKASGSIIVDATSGNSGNGGRDHRMHSEILESFKFTEVTFAPGLVKGTLAPQGSSRVEVSGQFRLLGQDHELTLPIDVQADGQQLKFSSHFIIPYVQWGVKNPSTFILRVSDKVTIDMHAVAQFVSP